MAIIAAWQSGALQSYGIRASTNLDHKQTVLSWMRWKMKSRTSGTIVSLDFRTMRFQILSNTLTLKNTWRCFRVFLRIGVLDRIVNADVNSPWFWKALWPIGKQIKIHLSYTAQPSSSRRGFSFISCNKLWFYANIFPLIFMYSKLEHQFFVYTRPPLEAILKTWLYRY